MPLIIHPEIDRCVSPEATMWITYCLAPGGDSAVDSGCGIVSTETRVRVQPEKIRTQRCAESGPPMAFKHS